VKISLSENKPSTARILWTDYPAFLSAAFIVAVWLIYLAWTPSWREEGPIIQDWMAPYALSLVIGITFICVAVITYRVLMLRALFRNGQVVSGRITSVSLARDRGRVEYVYAYHNKAYESGADIHRNKQTKELKEGERVDLLVDRNHPERAFIRDLYV
jgi:hypothetical protein